MLAQAELAALRGKIKDLESTVGLQVSEIEQLKGEEIKLSSQLQQLKEMHNKTCDDLADAFQKGFGQGFAAGAATKSA